MKNKRVLGGGLLLAAASANLVMAIELYLEALADLGKGIGLEVIGMWIGLFIIVVSIVGLIGGVLAIMGRAWILTILAAGLVILTGLFSLIGIFLGFAAVFILALSRAEFRGFGGPIAAQSYPPGCTPPTDPPEIPAPPPPYGP